MTLKHLHFDFFPTKTNHADQNGCWIHYIIHSLINTTPSSIWPDQKHRNKLVLTACSPALTCPITIFSWLFTPHVVNVSTIYVVHFSRTQHGRADEGNICLYDGHDHPNSFLSQTWCEGLFDETSHFKSVWRNKPSKVKRPATQARLWDPLKSETRPLSSASRWGPFWSPLSTGRPTVEVFFPLKGVLTWLINSERCLITSCVFVCQRPKLYIQ